MTDDAVGEQELRAMVRQSLARMRAAEVAADHAAGLPRAHPYADASHRLLPLLTSGDDAGMCLIEPTVPCSHCGYCLSYGH
jgi:hypothetical protein